MRISVPKFQFRFVPALGNVIHPGNFHPVGTQAAAQAMIDRARIEPAPARGSGGNWLVVGGSGGFGSAARVVLGMRRGAHTLNVSYDAQPNSESSNKVRKLGSPGFHRNLAIERSLRQAGLVARTVNGDAFDPAVRRHTIDAIREHFDGRIDGIIWALATPRAIDPRTGSAVHSVLRPLGTPVTIKTFGGKDDGGNSVISTLELEPGSPEEAIATIYVMGGGIVSTWFEALREAGVLGDGCTLLTVSYRGNALNEGTYRKGLIGLAKADLEFHTRALDAQLRVAVGGRALAVEGPAVVTEASGGIPGVSLYLAELMDVMGDRFEDPLASMTRMFERHFGAEGPSLDDEGLLRMDDRELLADIQAEVAQRFEAAVPGSRFDDGRFARFMTEYARTRGFEVPGVDYDAEFDTDEVCAQ